MSDYPLLNNNLLKRVFGVPPHILLVSDRKIHQEAEEKQEEEEEKKEEEEEEEQEQKKKKRRRKKKKKKKEEVEESSLRNAILKDIENALSSMLIAAKVAEAAT